MKNAKMIPLSGIDWDEKLYPRTQTDWLTVHQYADAMKMGAKFPPIEVCIRGGRFVGIDGKHRFEAAGRRKAKEILASIVRVSSEGDLFARAYTANLHHGRKLSQQERIAGAHRLISEFHLVEKHVAILTQIPMITLRRLIDERVDTVKATGMTALLYTKKAPLKGVTVIQNLNEIQKSLAARDQAQVFRSALAVLKAGAVKRDDEAVIILLQQLAVEIGKFLSGGKAKKRSA